MRFGYALHAEKQEKLVRTIPFPTKKRLASSNGRLTSCVEVRRAEFSSDPTGVT